MKLLMSLRNSADSIKLWRAAVAAGWSVERYKYNQLPDGVKPAEAVIYGDTLFAKPVADALHLSLVEPDINLLCRINKRFLKREVRSGTLGDARKLTTRTFVKPADEKSFDSKVYDLPKGLPEVGLLPEDTAVLMAEPVKWFDEYRCFVLDRRVKTMSLYSQEGKRVNEDDKSTICQPAVEETVHHYAESVIQQSAREDGVSFPDAFVIDIGFMETSGGHFPAVVEFNPAWCSGLYMSDACEVLSILPRCVRQAE